MKIPNRRRMSSMNLFKLFYLPDSLACSFNLSGLLNISGRICMVATYTKVPADRRSSIPTHLPSSFWSGSSIPIEFNIWNDMMAKRGEVDVKANI